MADVIVPNPPVPNEPFLDSEGNVSIPWRAFFRLLRLRTGGNSDNVNGAAPTGSGSLFYGSIAPSGWLFCDGAAISRVTFSELFGVIGTVFGVGDGSATFNIPDFRGRSVIGVGAGAGLTNRILAATGGLEEVALSEGELASHNHDFVNTNNTDEVLTLAHNHDLVNSANNDEVVGFAHNHDIVDSSNTDVSIPLEHNHDITDPGHDHNITDPEHNHGEQNGNFVNDALGTEYVNTGGDKGTVNANTSSANTSITIDSANTDITIDDALVNAIVGEARASSNQDLAWEDVELDDGTMVDSLDPANTDMEDVVIGDTGNNDAHENMMPFLVANYIIRTGVSS